MMDRDHGARRRRRHWGVVIVSAALVGAALGWRFRPRLARALDFKTVDDVAFDEASRKAQPARLRAPSGLARARLDEETVREILPLRSDLQVYDEFSYFRSKENLSYVQEWAEHPQGRFRVVTNSLGLRQDREIAQSDVDLRILVAGDSHMTGIGANSECFAALLEIGLQQAQPARSVEVINGAQGAYSFYHYLGVWERMLDLGVRPDLFIVVVYGGNDFIGGVFLWHFFAGVPRPKESPPTRVLRRQVAESHAEPVGQVLHAAHYFAENGRAEADRAVQVGVDVTLEIQRQCRSAGTELLVVYLPAPSEVPAQAKLARVSEGARLLALEQEDLERLSEMGSRYLRELDKHGTLVLDLRPSFREHTGLLYWERDLHLNLAGHALAASSVSSWVEDFWSRIRPAR